MVKFELGQKVYAVNIYTFGNTRSAYIHYGAITRIGIDGEKICYNIGENRIEDIAEKNIFLTQEDAKTELEKLFTYINEEDKKDV